MSYKKAHSTAEGTGKEKESGRKVKKRTHRLCQIGGAVESVLGCPIEEEDLPKLIGFLKKAGNKREVFSQKRCRKN